MYKGEEEVMNLLKDKQLHSLEEISKATALHIDSVRRIVEDLIKNGHITSERQQIDELYASSEFAEYSAKNAFPEYNVFKKALAGATVAQLSQEEKAIGLHWAKQKGFVTIEQGKLLATKTANEVEETINQLKNAYNTLHAKHTLGDSFLLEELYRRKWINKKTITTLLVRATGKQFAATGFDISTPAADASLGKPHPLSLLSQKIRQIFVELGFEESEGPIVESAFWNFDALFQPQDHPARELADTFYLKDEAPLPDKALAARVKQAHEKGWNYKWKESEARKRVLRTHTTALSARLLAQLGELKDKNPKKYFSIGKVFRNEATDYSHLTEFYQVEGIVIWEDATFGNLLGLLKEFYAKLGFDKIRFRPSYFPYTEPSLEVEVYFEPKKQWLELGGAGIFRPEVSIPLCNRYPVLAWGLSLERPLMLLLDLEDIRTLYKNDLDFLINCRVRI